MTANTELDYIGQVKERREPIKAPDGTLIRYEPDYLRGYAKV